MANIDVTLYGENRLKKSISLSVAAIKPAEIGAQYGNPNPGQVKNGDVLTLFTLPGRVVVTSVFLLVKTKATNNTATIKIDVGTTNLFAATAVGSVNGAVVGGLVGTAKGIYLPTGGEVKATVGAADLTDGDINVVIEYYEVGKSTGELTN